MPVMRETTCPLCGAKILDLGLASTDGVLCFNCYRKAAAREKERAVQEG